MGQEFKKRVFDWQGWKVGLRFSRGITFQKLKKFEILEEEKNVKFGIFQEILNKIILFLCF